tara:strand:+ start:3478 stop:4236 length:759 start_codon:yes stop_codon:yes gene_type:complete
MFFSKKLSQYKNIKHCFFSKKNGFSKGIYKSLNCGPGSNDNKLDIKKNLELVQKKMDLKNDNLILMNQTHSNKVIVIDDENKGKKKFNSDALITKLKGVALGVLTADCVPIILYDEKNKIISSIHAGWKGSISGIIENTLSKFKKIDSDNKIIAIIGPCIGKDSYEVGMDFYENFLKESEKNKNFFLKKEKNKFFFDIRGYVNNRLITNGITNIDNINIDTFKDDDNFFSYRRSKKLGETDYGRCISTICLI